MLTNCVSTKATMNQLRQDIGDDDVDQLGQDEDQDQLWQDDPLFSSQQKYAILIIYLCEL